MRSWHKHHNCGHVYSRMVPPTCAWSSKKASLSLISSDWSWVCCWTCACLWSKYLTPANNSARKQGSVLDRRQLKLRDYDSVAFALSPSVPFRWIWTVEGRNCCHLLFITWYRTTSCSCSRARSKAVEPHGYIPNRNRHARPRSEGDTPPGHRKHFDQALKDEVSIAYPQYGELCPVYFTGNWAVLCNVLLCWFFNLCFWMFLGVECD